MTKSVRLKPEDKMRVGNVWMLSILGVALTLDINESRAYRLVQNGDLLVEHEAGRKRYVRLSAVNAYRQRRDAWLRLHGRQTVTA